MPTSETHQGGATVNDYYNLRRAEIVVRLAALGVTKIGDTPCGLMGKFQLVYPLIDAEADAAEKAEKPKAKKTKK